MIRNVSNTLLSESDQYHCHECNYINTATDFAVKNVKAGNIHIASCTGCGARTVLNK